MNAYGDWDAESSVYPTKEGYVVPESCCKGFVADNQVSNCQKQPGSVTTPSKIVGCFAKLKESINGHKNKILIVSITILIVMFLNMLFAFALCTMAQ